MQKVRITAKQGAKSEIVRFLHNNAIADLRKASSNSREDNLPQYLPKLSEFLIRYKSAEHILRKYYSVAGGILRSKSLSAEKLIEMCEKTSLGHVFSANNRLKELQDQIAELTNARETAEIFKGTGIDFSMFNSAAMGFKAARGASRYVKNAKEALASHEARAEAVEFPMAKGHSLLIVAFEEKERRMVEEAMHAKGLSEIDIRSRLLNGSSSTLVSRLESIERALTKEANANSRALAKAAHDTYIKTATLLENLEIEVARAEAVANFKRTDYTFSMEAWVPSTKVSNLERGIRRITKGAYIIELLQTRELAPTLTKRPAFLRPFEYVMEFISVPRSDEIDPTWIFILTFPIFYGLMVTDAGYGVASLILSTLITMRSDPNGLLYNTAKIWQLSAVSAIVFGVLTNQYFGLSLNQYFGIPTIFSWVKNTTYILLATILFGMLQVILGLVFGFINNYNKAGHRKLAYSKLTSIAAILSGSIAIGGLLFHVFGTALSWYALAVAVIAIAATIATSGSEASEITNLITHPLSYSRILGFGMASVMIAVLIDRSFMPSLSSGPVAFLITLAIFIMLHVLNMVISMFEGIVQGVRLNVVEFFSKFYSGGGIKFSPFSYKRVYTKEEKIE
jgi:V/A-type H+-transporting ATPase subunit I